MQPLRSLDEVVKRTSGAQERKKLAVAWAQDPNTIDAIAKAVKLGMVEAVMIGQREKIESVASQRAIDPSIFTIHHVESDVEAARTAVGMVRSGDADILMKGLVATDKYLKAVLDKKEGLLPPGEILSHVTIVQIPAYKKLLFLTDVAVIPFPTLEQKARMLTYAVETARRFGIETPRAAILSATEKGNPKFESTTHAAQLCKMVQRGQIKNVIVDGPLDLFLACDPESVKIKGVPTPVNGEADILLFPNIEAGNILYKGLMLFAGGALAGLLQGTTKPVIVTSRSESDQSKFYSIAAACVL